MRVHVLRVVVALVLSLAIFTSIATAEELVNISRKTAVAVRITFSTRVMIMRHGREFSTQEPASGLSDVFVFSDGEVRRNDKFEVKWAPGMAIESVEWLEVYEEEQEMEEVVIALGFNTSPEIGIWSSDYGMFWQGDYRLSHPARSMPAVGLIEELSHDSLFIETQAVGSGTGIVFGYQDTENYFAFYQDSSAQDETTLILAEFSGRSASPTELVRLSIPSTERDRTQGSYMAVVVLEEHVECYFGEELMASLDCEGIPTPSGAGLYFGKIGGYGDTGIFRFLRISHTALLAPMPKHTPDTSQLGI